MITCKGRIEGQGGGVEALMLLLALGLVTLDLSNFLPTRVPRFSGMSAEMCVVLCDMVSMLVGGCACELSVVGARWTSGWHVRPSLLCTQQVHTVY